MQNILGVEGFLAFQQALNLEKSTSLRLNPKKGKDLFSKEMEIPWSSMGKKLIKRPSFTMDPLFHAGSYYVQDGNSQFLETALKQVVDLTKPLKVLDLCAAPGGKTTHIASLLSDESVLVANEVIHGRANILKENVWKWGYSNVIITSADPAKLAKSRVEFDVLLIDAPCSGEGLFRKDPGAIGEWSPAHVTHCSSRQKRILADTWPMLASDGVLLYSTCTWNKQENEEVLTFMLEQFDAEMVMLEFDDSFPLLASPHQGGNVLRFLPEHGIGEGYCIAALRKRSSPEQISVKPHKTQKVKPFLQANPLIQDFLKEGNWIPQDLGQEAFALLPHVLPMVLSLQEVKIHLLSIGIPLAEVFGVRKDVKPHPMLPHSTYFQANMELSVEVSLDEAIAYLARRDIVKDHLPSGKVCILYKGLPLGWGKSQNGRIISQYPMYYRIRKVF